DAKQAKQFVDEALRRDPNNSGALVLKKSLDEGAFDVEDNRQPPTAAVQAPAGANALPNNPPAAPQPPAEGDLLNSVEQAQRLLQKKVLNETAVALTEARNRILSDPAQALNDLKLLFDQVMRVGDLTADQRIDLRNRITALMQQASERRFE